MNQIDDPLVADFFANTTQEKLIPHEFHACLVFDADYFARQVANHRHCVLVVANFRLIVL